LAIQIGLTRERVRQLILKAHDVDGVPPVVGVAPPPVDLPWPVADKRPWLRWVRPTLSAAEVEELRSLHVLARELRGNHAADDPRRVASERVTSILADLLDNRGFMYKELADLLGVTIGAIRMRLKNHGYKGGPAPSQRAYQGSPRPKIAADNSARRVRKREIAELARPEPLPEERHSREWASLSDPQRKMFRALARGDRSPWEGVRQSIATRRSLVRRGLVAHPGRGWALTERGHELAAWVGSNLPDEEG
jgi:hypothetical protein